MFSWLSQLRKMTSCSQEFELPEKWHEWAPKSVTSEELFNEIERLRYINIDSMDSLIRNPHCLARLLAKASRL